MNSLLFRPNITAKTRISARSDKFLSVVASSVFSFGASSVFSFGYNAFGQLGLPRTDDQDGPTRIDELQGKQISRICGGHFHALAASDALLYSWGRNNEGQVTGRISRPHEILQSPSQLSLLTNANVALPISIAASGSYSVAVDSVGRVWSWGTGNVGQLGAFPLDRGPRQPTPIAFLPVCTRVASGWGHVCALSADGLVWSYGYAADGQLGRDLPNSDHVIVVEEGKRADLKPAPVKGIKGNVVDIACGLDHSVAVTEEGCVYTWGDGRCGQLGHGSINSSNVPRLVESLKGVRVKSVAAGWAHTAFVSDDGRLFMCGWSSEGQCGIISQSSSSDCFLTPMQVRLDQSVLKASCGRLHTAALTVDGKLYTWGSAQHGRLGHGDSDGLKRVEEPCLVEACSEIQVRDVSCGLDFTLIITEPIE